MKKMILTVAIAVNSLAVFADTAISRPANNTGVENVSKKAVDAFQNQFSAAAEVVWTTGADYYKASFVINERYMFAYYSPEGDLLGLTRYISPDDLPLGLQMNLKKNNSGYWISDLFEVAKNESTTYYLTLENADTKKVLKSTGSNDWEVFKTIRKS